MRTFLLAALTVSSLDGVVAQIGGTGQDGVFAPAQSGTLDTDRGPWMFSRIAIPAGVTIRLVGSAPALLLCTGDVDIDGTLTADGETAPTRDQPGAGGPGGYRGGTVWGTGEGPGGGLRGGGGCGGLFGCWLGSGGGGGHATRGSDASSVFPGSGGPAYGSVYPFEARGGSGGGGSMVDSTGRAPDYRHAGSGGGGVIVVLADGVVTVRGAVTARGGNAATVTGVFTVGGGAGAGGSVLVRSMRGASVPGVIDARGGSGSPNAGGAGGDGFVRVEAYGSAPTLGFAITPPARSHELPSLHQTATPRRGQLWRLTAVAVPADHVFLFLSLGPASLPLPPFGTLRIDPSAMLLAGVAPALVGHDPIAYFDLPVPDDAGVVGITLHAQAINAITSAAQARLSGSVAGTIAN